MQRYIIRRVLYACVSPVLLSITIFCLMRITGDPALLMVEPRGAGGGSAGHEEVRLKQK
jgi:ABC-type dipeptide/oligopeptide/nickel transport system permease component